MTIVNPRASKNPALALGLEVDLYFVFDARRKLLLTTLVEAEAESYRTDFNKSNGGNVCIIKRRTVSV
ncbi:MAG: hypothetical protein JWM11_3347 [Planctomycetaceae bacterium]|nr:hypothetical protein [Planctomycetaceae bacterium]